jgi:hypothetical protein
MTRLADKTIINRSHLKGAAVAADFQKDEFDILFRDKGYNVIHEKAIMCSCKSKESDHLSSCKNCGGSGWIFVNPTRTRMILTNMNLDKEYDDTARKDIGMVYVTAMHRDKLGFMDRIILEDAISSHTEFLMATEDVGTGIYVARTIYQIKEIEFVGRYIGNSNILTRLIEGTDFQVNNNYLQFTNNFELVQGSATNGTPSATVLEDSGGGFLSSGIEKGDIIKNITDASEATIEDIIDDTNIQTTTLSGSTTWDSGDTYNVITRPKISIRYRHAPVFYIWDIARDALVSLEVKGTDKRDPLQLAVKAIAKRQHLIAEAENLDGDRLLDNSWLPACPDIEFTKLEQIIKNTSMSTLYGYFTDIQKQELFTEAIIQGDALIVTSNDSIVV